MKIVAYVPLLYGAVYLDAAIRSIIDHIDELYVLYTDVGSHGHRVNAALPETEAQLYDIVAGAVGSVPATWVKSTWAYEGAQRDAIFTYAPDADIVIPLDYDEVWQPGLVEQAINAAIERPDIRNWRIPFRHYWRSFYKCILHDPAYPVRVINARANGGEATLGTALAVNHFGYAIPPYLMRWKWHVHGHKNELRRDVDYFTDIYEANRQYDCHPVGSEYWNAETIDPFTLGYLPDYMLLHLFSRMDVIE